MSTQVCNLPSDDEEVATVTKSFSQAETIIRKSYCRYGSGCTHINDTAHREKFWHPRVPRLQADQLNANFICNECGYGTSDLAKLQLHLQRKTAWSNASLVGCRINCLVDYKEWFEGYVLQYHKSGKHYVEFRQVKERRWLQMKKIAFYILERPPPVVAEEGEYKDDSDCEGLAPIEDDWVYCEDITLEYAFAQSVLFKIYGNAIQETGHLTKGHTCLTEVDRQHAQHVKGSLLYGELLPRGANKAFGLERLCAEKATAVFDLGMGTGKILIQAFLQFKNLRYVFGIELSQARYKLAEEALLKMVRLLGADSYQVQVNPGQYIIVTELVRVDPEDGEGEDGGEIAGRRATKRGRDGSAPSRRSASSSAGSSPRPENTETPSPYSHKSDRADKGGRAHSRCGTPAGDIAGADKSNERDEGGNAGNRPPSHQQRSKSRSNLDSDEGEAHSSRTPRSSRSPRSACDNSHCTGTDGDQHSHRSQHSHGSPHSADDGYRHGYGDDADDSSDGEYVERVLHFQCGNMFDIQNIHNADIVMMETDVPADTHSQLFALLSQMKTGARILTYLDLRKLWTNSHHSFRQLEVNRHQADRYPTSWSVQRGHHFYLWTKVDSTLAEEESRRHSPTKAATNTSGWEWARGSSKNGQVLDSPARENGGHFPRNNSNGSTRGPGARYTPPPTAAAPLTQRGGLGGVEGPAPNTHDSDDGMERIGQEGRCLPLFWFLGGSGRSARNGRRSDGTSRNGVKVPRAVTAVRTIAVAERESPTYPVNNGDQVAGLLPIDKRTTVREYNAQMQAATNSPKPHDRTSWADAAFGGGEQDRVGTGTTMSGRLDPGLRVDVGTARSERITTAGTQCVQLKTPRDSPRTHKKKKKHNKGEKSQKSRRDNRNASSSQDEGQEGSPAPADQVGTVSGPGAASEDPSGAILQREASATRPQVSRNNSLMRSSTSLDALRSAEPQSAPISPGTPLNPDTLVIETNSPVNSPVERADGSKGNSDRGVSLKDTPGDRSRPCSGQGGRGNSPAAEQVNAHTHITFVPVTDAGAPPQRDDHHHAHRHSRKHRDNEKDRRVRSPTGQRSEGAPGRLSSQAVAEATLLAESTNSAKSNGSSASRHRSGSRGGRRGAEAQSVESVALQSGLDRSSSGQSRVSRQRSGSGSGGTSGMVPAAGSPRERQHRTEQGGGNCTVS